MSLLISSAAIQANDPGGNSLMNYGYTYDAVSNITQKNTEHGVYNYAYDAVDRLTSVQPPVASGLSNESFAYDQAGNRTAYNGSAAWSYNAKDELVARPGVSYAYDANGNMIKKTEGGVVTDYVYNGENRLAQVKQGTTMIASYTYDPFGKRISKTTNGVTTYYAYSDEGLVAEMDSKNQWGQTRLINQIENRFGAAHVFGGRGYCPWQSALVLLGLHVMAGMRQALHIKSLYN